MRKVMTPHSITAVSLTAFCATFAAGIPGWAQPPVQSAQKIGFASEKEIFKAYPGDDVTLEDIDKKKAMRWTTKMNGTHRACIGDLKQAPIPAATKMRFQVRTDVPGELWVQVKESTGEAFYKIVKADNEWKDVSITLGDMKLNEDKVENRKLDIDKISQIIVIDLVGLGGASGKRSVWFTNWGFTDDKAKIDDQSRVTMPAKSNVARTTAAEKLSNAALHAKVESVLPRAEEERWIHIPWRTNLMQARLDAQRHAKPMLIWIMDGNVLGCT